MPVGRGSGGRTLSLSDWLAASGAVVDGATPAPLSTSSRLFLHRPIFSLPPLLAPLDALVDHQMTRRTRKTRMDQAARLPLLLPFNLSPYQAP